MCMNVVAAVSPGEMRPRALQSQMKANKGSLAWHHGKTVDGTLNCSIQPPSAKNSYYGLFSACFPKQKTDMAFPSNGIAGRCDLADVAIYFTIPIWLTHDSKLAPRPRVKGEARRGALDPIRLVRQILQYKRFSPRPVCRSLWHSKV